MDPNALLAIAQMMSVATRGPVGASDITMYTGQILAWDDTTDPPTNLVMVNGTAIPNMRAVTSGVGTSYQVDDVVLIMKRANQFTILGHATPAGGSLLSRPASDYRSGGNLTGATGSYRDLDGGGDSPSVTVRVPPRGNCAVFFGALVQCTNAQAEIALSVTGASDIPPGTFGAFTSVFGKIDAHTGGTTPTVEFNPMNMYNFRVGISPAGAPDRAFKAGLNTFTFKYKLSLFNATTTGCNIFTPWIWAFPY